MDFRFRATDNKQPCTPSSSRYSSDHPLPGGFPNAGIMPNWDVLRELENQRKEEIMIGEIARRRMLEAEVRKELIIEQALAIHRIASREERFTFDERFAMRSLDQRLNEFVGQSSRELLALPGPGSFNSLPLFQFPEPQKDERKLTDNEKDKIIFCEMPKPDPNHFEAKRKAGTPPAVADTEPLPSSLKKAKEEWICTACKITVTSETAFTEHLQGKKHRAKEGSGLDGKIKKRASSEEKRKKLNDKTEQALMQRKDVQKDSMNTGMAKAAEQGFSQTAEPAKRKGFKFWCEICQIGTAVMVVMETHEKRKKHRTRLVKLWGRRCYNSIRYVSSFKKG